MTKVKIFEDMELIRVQHEAERFLNEITGIQILDITWTHPNCYWYCIITYFEV